MAAGARRTARRYTALIALCALLLAGCVGMALRETRDHRAGGTAYGALAGQAVAVRIQPACASAPPAAPAAAGAAGDAAPPAEQAPVAVDFSALPAAEGVAAGWLYGADTPLNYPVMAGAGNAYYLSHLPDGTKNACGTPFVDAANAPDFSDRHTVIHGHHMKNGSMFAFLENYRDRAYYAAHPRLYLLTPAGDYRLDLVAGYTDEAGGEGFRTAFLDEAAFLAFVERARARSDFASPVEVLPGDRLVTLATCTYTFENARYLLLCRLTPLG